MKIFMHNKYVIAKHNQQYGQGKVSFKLGLNAFADFLPEEIEQISGFNTSAVSK